MALVHRLKASTRAVMKREKRLFMVKSLQKLVNTGAIFRERLWKSAPLRFLTGPKFRIEEGRAPYAQVKARTLSRAIFSARRALMPARAARVALIKIKLRAGLASDFELGARVF